MVAHQNSNHQERNKVTNVAVLLVTEHKASLFKWKELTLNTQINVKPCLYLRF